ncbi:MAG: alpha/beta hydrolase family protein [Bacilli bacterium]
MNNEQIFKEERHFQGLNYTLYTDGQPHPLLFFFHGFTGNRQTGIMGRGEVLANLGINVVAFDAPLHGDRSTQSFHGLTSSDKQKHIIDIVINYAHDAKWLYEQHLQYDRLISKQPIFAFGVSMGSQTSFYLATIMKELQTIITLVGSPSFCEFYEWKKQKYGWEDNEEYQKKQHEYRYLDPLINYHKFENKKIFIGVGIKDEIVPLQYARLLKDKLKEESYYYKEYDTAHASTEAMLQDAYLFIKKALLH